MKFKKVMIVSFILLAILMVGAVSASSDMDQLSQDSTGAVSIADEGIVDNEGEDECIFYSEGRIDIGGVDADGQTVIVAQFLSNTEGNITITDINNYEIFRKDVGNVVEGDEYLITYGDIKNINYLTTSSNILYLNFYNSDAILSGWGSFIVQKDNSGFAFEPIYIDEEVSFVLPENPVNPSKNECMISLVSSKDVDGFIEILQNDGIPIQEHLAIDSLEKYTYDYDKFGYKIMSDVFDFTQLQNGDIIKFFYNGVYGGFYSEFFRLVIEDRETRVYLDEIGGSDYPEFNIHEEIQTNYDDHVAILYIPSVEDANAVLYTGYVRVYGPYDENPIFESYIDEDYENLEFFIFLSDLNYFNGFENGNIVKFEFMPDNDDDAYACEYRKFYLNAKTGIITLENILYTNTTISAVYDDNVRELVSTLTDVNGQPINGANVVLNVNNNNFAAETDDFGQAKFSTADLTSGTYTATVSYDGSIEYNASSASIDIAVKDYTSISVVYDSETMELVATLTNNATGQPIKSANVRFLINNVKYTVKTDASGQAKFSTANLDPNTYNVIASYDGNSKYYPSSASIELILKADSNLSVVYNNGAREVVATLINNATDQAIKSANVRFTIGDVKQTVKSDANGQAIVSVADLELGTYTASVSYNGNSKYNSSITTVDFTITKIMTSISMYYDSETNELVATLINAETGKAIKGGNIVFNLEGTKTAIKTDKLGQARLAVSGVDLDNFHAAISYGGNSKYLKSTASIDIVAGKIPTKVSNVYNMETQEAVATLTNNQTGQAIKGATVVFNINGVKTAFKTDKLGQVKISVAELDLGLNSISSSYGGNSKYSKTTANINIFKI